MLVRTSYRKVGFHLVPVIIALFAFALIAIGCGSSAESSKEVPLSTPELTTPGDESSSQTLNDTFDQDSEDGSAGGSSSQGDGGSSDAPSQAQPSQPKGGTQAPAPPQTKDGGTEAPQQPNNSQNNGRPPSGSPAERFENFCADNPGACE
jgi:hypothetical protein